MTYRFHYMSAGRVPRRADGGDHLHRLGAETRRFRVHHAAAGAGTRGRAAGGGMATNVDRDGRPLPCDRQYHRDCADQSQAHAGVFHDWAYGVPAARDSFG